MGKRDEKPKPRNRVRRRRRRKRPRPDEESEESSPPRGEDYVEVGQGDFCVMTIPHDGDKAVVHRFETREEAREQYRKNVEHDKPLAEIDDEPN